MTKRLHGSIIVTYRCNARCNMCDVWNHMSRPVDEIGADVIRKLPSLFFANVTGGEPFVRQDLPEIICELRKKARRIVVSTNGFFTDRIVELCAQYPDLGIRISIEGLEATNDRIRGIPHGYQKTQATLQKLRAMGMKDIGFAMTVQDWNFQDLLDLYRMARSFDYEFATATVHNSHYFQKFDNNVARKKEVAAALQDLIKSLLSSSKVKEWFRAYFNYGLINYIQGRRRLLPCEMGHDGFFLDPYGDILACNGMDRKESMGNLRELSWDQIWHSPRAEAVRQMVKTCSKNCWMIGSASPAIWNHPLKPALWVLKNKIRLTLGREVS